MMNDDGKSDKTRQIKVKKKKMILTLHLENSTIANCDFSIGNNEFNTLRSTLNRFL